MGTRRIVVTGLGAVTPLGVGAHTFWARLVRGESGLASLLTSRPPYDRWRGLPCTVAGLVPPAEWSSSDWMDDAQARRIALFTQYALAASELALQDAGWRPRTDVELESTGVCLGSGIGNLDEAYNTSVAFSKGGYHAVSPLFIPRLLLNMAAGQVAMKHGLRGPNHSVTTACTTGAHSIGDAARFIAAGDAEAMLAGASEACVHPLTIAGFARARSLSTAHNDDPPASCRPFDASRDGFIVAEGAAVLLLEELGHARSRGARIYAELRGYGCSGDAHHPTSPRPDGAGALLAMRRALRAARLTPASVNYLNAHATGTRAGDAAEVAAVRGLMLGEDGVLSERDVTISSTKAATGHLLGAAGALEAVICVLAVANDLVPPTLNLSKPDVGADFDFVPLTAQQRLVKVAMSNSFGFGGTNSTLVFAKLE